MLMLPLAHLRKGGSGGSCTPTSHRSGGAPSPPSRTAATASWSVVKTRASPIAAVMPCRSMSDSQVRTDTREDRAQLAMRGRGTRPPRPPFPKMSKGVTTPDPPHRPFISILQWGAQNVGSPTLNFRCFFVIFSTAIEQIFWTFHDFNPTQFRQRRMRNLDTRVTRPCD